MVGFPTSGWVSNQWVEIHPWWVIFQPFTLVGLGAVVEEEELEYGRGGRKESDDLMLQLDSIIPGVLEPFGKSE